MIIGTLQSAESEDPFQIDLSITRCQQYLVAEGFENVQFSFTRNHSLWITYENRVYRNEITALGIVLYYVAKNFPLINSYVIIPLFQDIPLFFLQINRSDYTDFMSNQIRAEEFLERLSISYHTPSERPIRGYQSQKINLSRFRMDLEFAPGLRSQFGRPGDPMQMQFNILGNISSTFARGLSLKAQWIAPIYNEFRSYEDEQRPGHLFLSQFIRLPQAYFISVSAGLFENQVYGVSSQVSKFFFCSRLIVLARLDYLNFGERCFFNSYFTTNPDHYNYLAGIQYNLQSVNFSTRLTWGKFLLGDRSWKLDVVRSFDELEIGFMGIWNETLGVLTGMTVRVPFPIARHAAPAPSRIRSTNYVNWNYRYLPRYEGYITESGVEINDIYRYVSRGFLVQNIDSIKTAMRHARFYDPYRHGTFASGGNK